jgi:hypothetical protein
MNARAAIAAIFMLALGAPAAPAQDEEYRAALARALQGTKVTLEDGLTASEGAGKPISAKFEVEDGKLQLSVYGAKGGDFAETIIDPETGAVTKSETITDEDDLEDAQALNFAMDKARMTLLVATQKAVEANDGFRAVSITPWLKQGHPVADVTLLRTRSFKTVEEKLD